MPESRLPPLRLNSPTSNPNDTPRSNASSTLTANMSARERRRKRNSSISRPQSAEQTEDTVKPRTPRKSRSNSIAKDIDEVINSNRKRPSPKRKRITRRSISENTAHVNDAFVGDEGTDKNDDSSPKRASRTKKDDKRPPVRKRQGNQRKLTKSTSNPVILNGLEDDVVAVDDETDAKESYRVSDRDFSSDRSQKPLVHTNISDIHMLTTLKSIPTDKYYIELGNKFQIQNKHIYEKREESKRVYEIEQELKQKQREEMKYQILTPRTALRCHKFIRFVFLFMHGLNVGFQFWNTLIVNLTNYSDVTMYFSNNVIFDIFRHLILPVHCLSYFFIVLCIIDVMDRVDFTQMTWPYFIKCISFQNSFWSIILYLTALVASLAMINVDDDAYILANSNQYNMTVATVTTVQTWKSLSIVKSVTCSLSWILFCVFYEYDMTYQSLEKRDFTLLDELVAETDNKNNLNKTIQNETPNTVSKA